MTTQPMAQRSRLDPDPVPRRDFLGLASTWAALSALAFAAIGMLRLPKAAVVAGPAKSFRLTLPETLLPDQPFVPPGRAVAVYRDEDGVYAISLVCTHLGCIVRPTPEGFMCPCHGSYFGPRGAVSAGPAPKDLPWLKVTGSAGTYIVDEGTTVPVGTKVQA